MRQGRDCVCGTPVRDGGQLVCRGCLTPLRWSVAGDRATTARYGASPERPAEPAGPRAALRLELGRGQVEVRAGESVGVGRDPEFCPFSGLLESHRAVSNRHATVGVDTDGAGWVRDEASRYGTWLGGRRLTAGERAALRAGDTLLLAEEITVRVLEGAR